MKIYLFILLTFSLLVNNLWAQIPNLKIEHYSVDNGLSQGSANCIFQDKKGFIWIGTQDGLNKFDGYKFLVYQHNPLDTCTLSGNWVYGIDEDDNGIIWLATQNGLNSFNPATDKFKHYDVNNEEEIFSSCQEFDDIDVINDRCPDKVLRIIF